MCANHAVAPQVHCRKRPFRPRKRVLSARANGKPDQSLKTGSAEVEPRLHENFSRKPKGGAPRGNTNRLIHGKYTRERRALFAAIRAHIKEGRELIAWAALVKAQRDLRSAFLQEERLALFQHPIQEIEHRRLEQRMRDGGEVI